MFYYIQDARFFLVMGDIKVIYTQNGEEAHNTCQVGIDHHIGRMIHPRLFVPSLEFIERNGEVFEFIETAETKAQRFIEQIKKGKRFNPLVWDSQGMRNIALKYA